MGDRVVGPLSRLAGHRKANGARCLEQTERRGVRSALPRTTRKEGGTRSYIWVIG